MPYDIKLKKHLQGFGADILINGQVVGQIHFPIIVSDNYVNVIFEPLADSEYKLMRVDTDFGESGRARRVLIELDRKPRPISLKAIHHLGQELTPVR